MPAALHELWRRDRERADARTLLNWWIAGPLVVFSLAVTRLPHYILPMWPALALAAASTVERTTSGIVDARARRWLRLGAPIAGVCAVVLCATVIGVSYAFGTRGMFVWLPLLIPAIVAAGIASFRLVRGDGHAWPLAVAAVIVLEAVGGLLWLPGAEAAKPVPIIAALIRSRMPRQAPIATLEFDEPSLRFYLGMTPTRIASSEQLQRWVDAAEPAVLVTTRAAMNRSGLSRLSLEELGSAAGFDVASVRQIELVALVRGARRP